MDVNQIKISLELQALQNFAANKTKSTPNTLFMDVFNNLLWEHSQSLPFISSENSKTQIAKQSATQPFLSSTALLPIQLTKQLNSVENYDDLITQASERYQVPAKLIK